MKKILIIALVLLAGVMLMAAPLSAAGGTGPGDSLWPLGQSQTLTPHSAQWYQFKYTGDKSSITATVDDNGATGIRLSIYTPQEVDTWTHGGLLTPIGVGSQPPQLNSHHDWLWKGSFNFPGTFYAVVNNDSDANVSVAVMVSGDGVTTLLTQNPMATPLANPFATVTPLGKGVSGHLVFSDASGGNIYTVNGDGTHLQKVTFGMDPQWNHSGTQIALARQGPIPGIFTVNADGSNETLLYQTNEVRAPDWSPDNSQIIFSFQKTLGNGSQQCFTFRGKSFCFSRPATELWKLATVNSAGGGYTDVQATNDAFTPTWNSDGNTVAFNDLSIGIMQMSLTNNYPLFPFIGDLRITATDYNPLKLMSPQYSPDGKHIVYMVLQQPSWQIAVANADGSNQHLLTSLDPLDFVHPNNAAPVWSPDSKQIMFLSDRNGKWEFFTMNADGSGQQQVLKNITDQIPLTYQFQSERMISWTK